MGNNWTILYDNCMINAGLITEVTLQMVAVRFSEHPVLINVFRKIAEEKKLGLLLLHICIIDPFAI